MCEDSCFSAYKLQNADWFGFDMALCCLAPGSSDRGEKHRWQRILTLAWFAVREVLRESCFIISECLRRTHTDIQKHSSSVHTLNLGVSSTSAAAWRWTLWTELYPEVSEVSWTLTTTIQRGDLEGDRRADKGGDALHAVRYAPHRLAPVGGIARSRSKIDRAGIGWAPTVGGRSRYAVRGYESNSHRSGLEEVPEHHEIIRWWALTRAHMVHWRKSDLGPRDHHVQQAGYDATLRE